MEQSYKEKYEQALEKATIYHKQGNEDMKLMMETCFPELAESEDEKMREELIRSFKSLNTIEIWNGIKRSDILAWLEKQGEKKPVEENKGNLVGISANWSEEDEMFVHGLIRGLTAKRDIHGHTTFSSDCIDITKTIDWLKSIKYRVQPQPKQEWNEEDSIRLQRIIDFLWYNRKGDTDTICQQEQDIDWLKSLRPLNRWKPSELQLGCLSDAIEYYNSLGYPAPKLKELYEQLKKL